MHKITEKEYLKWKNTDPSAGVEWQLEKILRVLDQLLMDKSNQMVVKGIAASVLACNCRYLYEEYGMEVSTTYKWKELFEREL